MNFSETEEGKKLLALFLSKNAPTEEFNVPKEMIDKAFKKGFKAGQEQEREDIFGTTQIEGFRTAKGLLNKLVLEQIKENCREQERQKVLDEVEKIITEHEIYGIKHDMKRMPLALLSKLKKEIQSLRGGKK